MCTTIQYKVSSSPTFTLTTDVNMRKAPCGHKWLVIDTPCGYGKGFSAYDSFKGGKRARAAACPKIEKGSKEDCPWHGLKGNYDFNRIRMIESTKRSICLPPAGPPPPGSDVLCCVIQ
jgi:hypothetical protein